MDRRGLLKVLPLAAMAGATVRFGEGDATAFEIKPNKKYLFVIPAISADDARKAAANLRSRGVDAIIASGDMEMKIYELG